MKKILKIIGLVVLMNLLIPIIVAISLTIGPLLFENFIKDVLRLSDDVFTSFTIFVDFVITFVIAYFISRFVCKISAKDEIDNEKLTKKEINRTVALAPILTIVPFLIYINTHKYGYDLASLSKLGDMVLLGVYIMIYIVLAIIIIAFSSKETKIKTSFRGIKKIISIIFIIALALVIWAIYNINNGDVYGVLDENYQTPYYFIHNDKIYYYHDYTGAGFYSMDFDGKNNKLLCKADIPIIHGNSDNFEFYFVYNNELYYSYSNYGFSNEKINLDTGKITKLGNEGAFLPETLSGNYINTFVDNNSSGASYFKLNKINIANNETIYSNMVPKGMAGESSSFNYDTGDVYYTADWESDKKIYKNNELIYDPTKKMYILFNKDNYLFLYDDENIYKFDMNTKKIKKTISNKEKMNKIKMANSTDNYFYGDNSIYSYNFENDDFELLVSDISTNPWNVYKIKNKLIFTSDYVTYDEDVEEHGMRTIVILDLDTKQKEEYNYVKKVSVDGEDLYLTIKKNKKEYVIKKIDL